jgi:hypothetical protein
MRQKVILGKDAAQWRRISARPDGDHPDTPPNGAAPASPDTLSSRSREKYL